MTFIPDPSNYTMKRNPMVRPQSQHIDPDSLFQKDMTDEDLKKLAKEKLSYLLQGVDAETSPSLLLSVCREIMDRIEGKPTQRIEQKVEHTSKLASTEMTNDQLIAALRKAEADGLLPRGTKLLQDGTVITDAEYSEVLTPTEHQ